MIKTKDDLTIQELRNLEGLDKRTHETIEGIIRRMETPVFEDVEVTVEVDENYMPKGWSLD